MVTSYSAGDSAPAPDTTHGFPALLVVSDGKLFRNGLAAALGDWPFRTVVAAEFAEASRFRLEPWNLILMDIPSREDPSELLARTGGLRHIPRVVITDSFTFEVYAASLRAQVSGFLLEEMSIPACQVALFLIMKGKTIWPTQQALARLGSMQYAQFDEQAFVSEVNKRSMNLTPQEIRILRCLVRQGGSNKQLARQLGNTEATIKVHMKTLLRKIGVQNRTQVAMWALTNGFGATSF